MNSPYLNLPLREQSDVAISNLLNAIEEGRTAVLNMGKHDEIRVMRETMKHFQTICTLADRYRAALASKPSVPETVSDEHASILDAVRDIAHDR